MAGESEVTAVLNITEHTSKELMELLKKLLGFGGNLGLKVFGGIGGAVKNSIDDVKEKDGVKELNAGIVKQKNLLHDAKIKNKDVVMQDGINKKDLDIIGKKAKEYGISIAVTGESDADNMKVFLKESDKAVFDQILTDIVKEKIETRPDDLISFKIKPWAVEAMKAELLKHDLSASFIKDKDGDIHCVYEASDKKAFDIAKNEFKKIHEEVSKNLEIESKDGFTVIKDTVNGKEISFDEILSKEQLKKVIEEDFGYGGVKAELAANKFGNTLSAEEQQKFLQDNPMYEVNSLEYDIKLENENILLNDFSFININLKKDGVNQIVVMDNKNETAAAFSPDLKQADIEEILREKIGITDTATIAVITDKIEKVYDIYETEAQGNMSMDITEKKNNIGTCEIERKNKNEFEIKLNGKVSSYNFNDKLDSLINIRRELMKAGMTVEGGVKTAREIYKKAQAQSIYRIMRNEAKDNSKDTDIKAEKTSGFKIERELGGTFTVSSGDKIIRYDLIPKEAATEKMKKDFGISGEKAERIYNKAAEQNGVENEMRKDKTEQKAAPKTEKTQTKTQTESVKTENNGHKRR